MIDPMNISTWRWLLYRLLDSRSPSLGWQPYPPPRWVRRLFRMQEPGRHSNDYIQTIAKEVDRDVAAVLSASGCACPRLHARDCARVRAGEDLAELLDPMHIPSDDECDCVCHDEHMAAGEEDAHA